MKAFFPVALVLVSMAAASADDCAKSKGKHETVEACQAAQLRIVEKGETVGTIDAPAGFDPVIAHSEITQETLSGGAKRSKVAGKKAPKKNRAPASTAPEASGN